ncbi:MAG: SBBP repeat-containing protein [Xenococcaceae cyanobacterium MO_207.B15]|nr:SBBP repeat-containing protein [Xenococcaceae cyanobacterium MO_207.B15]
MNEEFIEAIDNNLIVEGEPIADEIATDLLVDESSLTPTDATEAFIETFDSSDSTAAQQEQAVEEIVEAIVEEPLDIPIPDDVLETLIAFINDLTVAGTPASDAFQVGSTGTDLILGREGNDVILAVNPQLDLPGLGETDIFSGGSESDRFILGDRRKAYYDDGDDSTTGDNDVAIIVDFNPNEDVIQLHGSPEDYTLVDFAELGEGETGTAIFLRGETNDELIGSLNNVGGLNLDADYFQFKNGSSGEPVLSLIKQFGTAGIDLSFTIANSKDRSNSVLVAGYTSGNLGRRNRGAMDGFFTRYNSQGTEQWTRQIGTTVIDNSYGIDTDTAGNIYLLSRTNGRLAGANAGIGNDVVLSKYNRRGSRQWQIQFGSPGNDNPFVDPRVDSSGNVLIAGYTNDDLGGINADTEIPPSADAWIAKYDSNGNQLWIEQFGTDEGDETFGLDIDSEDNIYTTGWTRGNLGAPNNLNPDGEVTYDIWLAKYDTDGNQEWIEQFGTNTFDWSWDVATDLNDDIYITGWTLGSLEGSNAGSYDIWLAKYDSDGNQLWIDQFGTTGDDAALGIDVDELGNYYLTGYTDGDLTGEGNAGSYDAWVAKYDSDGNQLWIQQFGSSELDNAYEVSVSGDNVFVTGVTEGSLGSTNAGSYDAWIGRFSATDGTLLEFDSPSSDSFERSGEEL